MKIGIEVTPLVQDAARGLPGTVHRLLAALEGRPGLELAAWRSAARSVRDNHS